MVARQTLKRKSFFVDEHAVQRARRVLGAASDAEAIRMSVDRVAEIEAFWRFMQRTRRGVKPRSIEAP